MPDKKASDLIETLNLTPHPEGGFYREIYRSSQCVNSPVNNHKRCAVTQIYYLLSRGDFSRFHRVSHDEIWHIYDGDPLLLISWDGHQVIETRIGNGCKNFCHTIKAGIWQAAFSTGDFTLSGCTVAPGFEFQDFSFLSDDPKKAKELAKAFPEYRKYC